ncbi:MAG: hypothetical protein GY716_21720 [bacterium]|nr:hypothetical protein [bacterium]
MRRPIIVATILGVLFAVATLALLLYSATTANQHSCNVCMQYLGRNTCREAMGATREEATNTAKDNACAFLASGMTQTVECTARTAPVTVTCEP